MKRVKVLLLILCLALSVALFCACEDEIPQEEPFEANIIGDEEATIELNATYEDQGILCSEKYTVVTENGVENDKVGEYQIVYKIYSKDGELLKQLSRTVKVVDTTAPTYQEKSDVTYYVGFSYGAADFITYSDNCDEVSAITCDFTTKTFTLPGEHEVTINLIDHAGNKATFTKTINVVYDLEKLIREVYKDQPEKIKTDTEPTVFSADMLPITYVTEGDTMFFRLNIGWIGFSKSIKTSLGDGFLGFLCHSDRKFNSVQATFVIQEKSESSTTSSFMSGTCDATKQYTVETVPNPTQKFGSLNLNETEMRAIYKEELKSTLADFQTFMSDVLHIDIQALTAYYKNQQ